MQEPLLGNKDDVIMDDTAPAIDDNLNPFGGPVDPEPNDSSKATSLQACCVELLWKAGLFFGFLFGIFQLGKHVSGVYLLAFPLVIGVGLGVQGYTRRRCRTRLLLEYSLQGTRTHCTIVQRDVDRVRRHHHHHHGRHAEQPVTTRETETVYFLKARYQAHVRAGYQRRDGVVVQDDDVDVLVEHRWKVGRDLYYSPVSSLELFYLPSEPKSGIPVVFVDPSIGDAGSGEATEMVAGAVIALVPLLLVLLVAGVADWSTNDFVALIVAMGLGVSVGFVTYRQRVAMEYDRVVAGERAQIVGWLPRDMQHQGQPCSVPEEGEDDYGPTVSVALGPNSSISMVASPATSARVVATGGESNARPFRDRDAGANEGEFT